MGKTYFAADGSYGDAEDILIIDTTDWTDDEWTAVDCATDLRRRELVLELISEENEDQDSLPGLEL